MSNGNKMQTVTPFSLAMIVCDFIYRDPFTLKLTIMGTFSAIAAHEFPTKHPQLFVYTSLTGGRGTIPLRLKVVDVDEARAPVLEIEDTVEFANNPNMVNEVAFGAVGVAFPEPGEYRVQLFANEEFIVERRLMVLQHPHGT